MLQQNKFKTMEVHCVCSFFNYYVTKYEIIFFCLYAVVILAISVIGK